MVCLRCRVSHVDACVRAPRKVTAHRRRLGVKCFLQGLRRRLSSISRDLKGIPVENIEEHLVGGESYRQWLTGRATVLGIEPRTTSNHKRYLASDRKIEMGLIVFSFLTTSHFSSLLSVEL